MSKRSGGILVYKRRGDRLEVLLVHPGGPFWKNKETGAWSIPKGEPQEGEELLSAARRELREEIGLDSQGDLKDLGTIQQKGEKRSTLGRSRWIRRRLSPKSATRSNWSGLHDRERCKLFPRLTVPSSSESRRRKQGSIKPSGTFSSDCPRVSNRSRSFWLGLDRCRN